MRWYYGWNIVAVGMLFQAVIFGLIFYTYTFWAEAWMGDFGIERSEVMMPFFIATLAMGIVISPFAGRLMDTRSIRHLIIIGLFCIALGFFLIAQATALWQIIAIYATLVPIGVVLAGPLPAQTLVSRWFGKRRGLALGIVTTGTSVGGMTIPLLVSNTVVDFGWRAIHEFIALGIALTLPIIVWFVVRNHPGDMGLQAEPEADLKP
ncbi:MAG: MFS transporter, partial [Alphaproteobacteria bacterium]|nr:MFS transporter [Alphaproteobacteria bacterium]